MINQEFGFPVIFLDIDGVLNNEIEYVKRMNNKDPESDEGSDLIRTCSGEVSARCVELLNILIKNTSAKIVVSSTWRLDGLEKMVQALKEAGVVGEVIAITGQGSWDTVRGNEIQTWIRQNKEILGYDYYWNFRSFIILDDDSDMLLWQKDHFFQTDPYCGLTPYLVEKAGDFLKRTKNYINDGLPGNIN